MDKELNKLIEVYTAAREQLLDTIVNYKGVGTKVYANTIYKQVELTLQELAKAANDYSLSAVPKEYEKALNETYAYFKRNNLLMRPPASFARVHHDTIYLLVREMQHNISDGIAQIGRQVLRYVDSSRDEALRAAGLSATGEKLASGSTIRQMQKNLIGKLQEQGFMTVQYGSGGNAYQVSLDIYTAMVARSTTREAGNMARETQLKENGYDLMKMSVHFPTCEVCAPLQGRVYSISGKDKRFPSIERVYRNGYRNVHPNCRHVMTPFVEELQTDDEMQAEIAESNKPFVDPRPEVEKKLYNEGQAKNRRIRQDRYQYERYKARLGEDAPKSFSAFRRMKKVEGEAWENLQGRYREVGQESMLAQSIGKATPPREYKNNFDDFEPLKLSKKEEALLTELHKGTLDDGLEHGLVVTPERVVKSSLETAKSVGMTSEIKKIIDEAPPKSLTLLHSHTNSTPPSVRDLENLLTPSVDKVGVIAYNGDVFMVSIGSGDTPSLKEFKLLSRKLADKANFDVIKLPSFSGWSPEERNYVAIREQFFRIARELKWKVEGGRIK